MSHGKLITRTIKKKPGGETSAVCRLKKPEAKDLREKRETVCLRLVGRLHGSRILLLLPESSRVLFCLQIWAFVI